MAETDEDDGPPGDKKMPLLDHLVELRSRLIWSIVAFFAAFLVAYLFLKEPIFQFLLQPLAHLPHGDSLGLDRFLGRNRAPARSV